MTTIPPDPADSLYASPSARDAFLNALDADNREQLVRLSRDLTSCNNPLPGIARDDLGLPVGATYGVAARHILSLSTENHAGTGNRNG